MKVFTVVPKSRGVQQIGFGRRVTFRPVIGIILKGYDEKVSISIDCGRIVASGGGLFHHRLRKHRAGFPANHSGRRRKSFPDVGLHPGGLVADSPCINAGSNEFATTEVDFYGDTRIVDGRVDMGASEFQRLLTGYAAWAATNGVTGTWDAKDALGIHNVLRYVFNVPTGTFDNPPLLSISINADGNAVIQTPKVVNSDGFEL